MLLEPAANIAATAVAAAIKAAVVIYRWHYHCSPRGSACIGGG